MKKSMSKLMRMFAGRERCAICGCFERKILCEECFAQLKFEFEKRRKGRLCRLCGKPLISEIEMCCECRENEAEIVPGRALFEYRGIGKEGIRAFKFKNERSFGAIYADFLALFFRSSEFSDSFWESDKWTAVPVPGNRKNIRLRGWDPVAVVVEDLKSRGFAAADLLERKKWGKGAVSLKMMNRQQRLSAALDSYRLREGAVVPQSVLLIDDVRTTGSTIKRCALLLKEAGAREVRWCALAETP